MHRPLQLLCLFCLHHSKSNCHFQLWKSNFTLFILEHSSNSRSWSSLVFLNFHFQLKSVFHYYFWNFHSQNQEQKLSSNVRFGSWIKEQKFQNKIHLESESSKISIGKTISAFKLEVEVLKHQWTQTSALWFKHRSVEIRLSFWNVNMNRIPKSTSYTIWFGTIAPSRIYNPNKKMWLTLETYEQGKSRVL